MSILAYGLNHSTAPLELREQLCFAREIMTDALKDLTRMGEVQEAAILSTCNRTEVYCSVDDHTSTRPVQWLSGFHGVRHNEVQPYLYTHPDANAVKHMLRVASGLDSMVLGEPQVLGQLKEAYQVALETGSIGKLLNRLFQHSFHVAKDIRSNTSIGSHPVSVAFAAVRLAQQIFGDLSQQTALLIGAGETIELVARHLHENGLKKMIIANRTVERSRKLADEFSGYAIALSGIPDHLAEADVVISSTASQLPILGKGAMESAIRQRKHKPVFMVDIAVPRDIEPEVGDMDDIYLYTVDDLKDVIQENMNNRKQAALQAEEIIEAQVLNFMEWLNSLDAVDTIRALRRHAGSIQDEVLQGALLKLQNGADPAVILKEVTHTLTNKLIHTPSSQLRNAGVNGRIDLLSATHELFDLKEQGIPKK